MVVLLEDNTILCGWGRGELDGIKIKARASLRLIVLLALSKMRSTGR